MGKKKKGNIAKRRARSRQKTEKKRKLRLVKGRSKEDRRTIYRPGLSELGAPEGFRSVPPAQAMMEYAKPLMELVKGEEDFEDAMQAGMVLWNYALSVQKGDTDKKIEQEILKEMGDCFSLDHKGAKALFMRMIERQGYLFPPDIQPKGSPFMFIRKEVRHLIKPFDYTALALSDEIIPPDKKDKVFVDTLDQLDSQISAGVDYGEYESLFLSLKDKCHVRFEKWLRDKGLSQDIELFSSCLDIYLDFVYGYMHDDVITLKTITLIYVVEFFEDYLVRKVMTDPDEYVYWPPAVKLFYDFLHEKGYLEKPEKIIREITEVEPYFIQALKKQFA
ncbi:MAG: hypothetical protein SWE60_00175 [Thermodesulfobacteriota bacterium]|nr:hypothetical protein [Thermodesulfobacteriota bacterium]